MPADLPTGGKARREVDHGRGSMIHRQGFAAMGTTGEIVIVDGPVSLLDRAIARIDELEARWSRFRTDSEISALNRAAGRPVAVSADTFRLVELAVDAWRATAGWFDPTVLPVLLELGYTHTFELLEFGGLADLCEPDVHTTATAPPTPAPMARPDCGAIRLDSDDRTVSLPPGVLFDPGGIGKGLAADLVAEELIAAGARGALVDLGGDVRVIGDAPHGLDWTIAIAITDPFQAPHNELQNDEMLIHLRDGAVATSSCLHRRWSPPLRANPSPHPAGQELVHHLIDPHTGRPAESGLIAASVVAANAVTADVVAKSALLAGPTEGPEVIDALNTAGLLVRDTGDLIATHALRRFT